MNVGKDAMMDCAESDTWDNDSEVDDDDDWDDYCVNKANEMFGFDIDQLNEDKNDGKHEKEFGILNNDKNRAEIKAEWERLFYNDYYMEISFYVKDLRCAKLLEKLKTARKEIKELKNKLNK